MSPASRWFLEVEGSIDALTLCHSMGCDPDLIVSLVHEGVLEPQGEDLGSWHFAGTALQRAARALRLACDLEINPPGVALALLLIDEIARLESAAEADATVLTGAS